MLKPGLFTFAVNITKFKQASTSRQIMGSGNCRHVPVRHVQIVFRVCADFADGRSFAIDDVQRLAIVDHS